MCCNAREVKDSALHGCSLKALVHVWPEHKYARVCIEVVFKPALQSNAGCDVLELRELKAPRGAHHLRFQYAGVSKAGLRSWSPHTSNAGGGTDAFAEGGADKALLLQHHCSRGAEKENRVLRSDHLHAIGQHPLILNRVMAWAVVYNNHSTPPAPRQQAPHGLSQETMLLCVWYKNSATAVLPSRRSKNTFLTGSFRRTPGAEDEQQDCDCCSVSEQEPETVLVTCASPGPQVHQLDGRAGYMAV